MRFAILDFGTNTFNLLIAEQKGQGFIRKYTGKQPVKLGKGGINKGYIADEAMERGRAAIAHHMQTISKYDADHISAWATSAFRNAKNGKEFAQLIEKEFGFEVNIIPGDEEADLIYRGIRASVEFGEENVMIMDIGGGSNELIICNGERVHWKHSFELGMARILERFVLSDPITPDEILTVKNYFWSELTLLFEQVKKYHPGILVGASGSFDTLAAMQRNLQGQTPSADKPAEITLEQFRNLKNKVLMSTIEERLAMPGMEPVRVEMIVPAVIFINLVIEECGLISIVQSDYALKEGVVSRFIENMQ